MRRVLLGFLLCLFSFVSFAQTPVAGVVVMHGKGGSPQKFVSELARHLESRGCLVANLDMPWSGAREYGASVADADAQIRAALTEMRARGATRVFVAGHSQGGLFALSHASRHPVDGVIAIAPGGSVGSNVFLDKLGYQVAKARQLVAEGKGQDKTQFADYEGSKGMQPIATTPALYLDWFSPEGAMDSNAVIPRMRADIPVLYVAPLRDYPSLAGLKQKTFNSLPARSHTLTRLYEPDASHLEAPAAAGEEIFRWMSDVISKTKPVQ